MIDSQEAVKNGVSTEATSVQSDSEPNIDALQIQLTSAEEDSLKNGESAKEAIKNGDGLSTEGVANNENNSEDMSTQSESNKTDASSETKDVKTPEVKSEFSSTISNYLL